MIGQLDAAETPARGGRTGCRALPIHLDNLTSSDLARWRELAARSTDANAFLLPEFVLPGWRRLRTEKAGLLLVAADETTGDWLCAGVFADGTLSARMPLAHWAAARNRHAFRSGLLLDADRSQEALDALLAWLADSSPRRHGVEFTNLRLDSRVAAEISIAADRHELRIETVVDHFAPCVQSSMASADDVSRLWTKSRRKSIRQSLERLSRRGPVSLALHREPRSISEALPTFLRLEAAGWKGAEGTACLSNSEDLEFVEEMVTGLAEQGQVAISELRAGSIVVASAVNLMHADTLFAFKIGWDAEFADVGPGTLHEVELMRSQLLPPDVRLLDSCAMEDSYIGRVWPGRSPIGIARLTWTPLSRWTSRVADSLTVMRRFFQE